MEQRGRSGRPGSSEFGLFLGARLREERRLAGATRETLSMALGVSTEIVEQCESNGRLLRAHHLAAAWNARPTTQPDGEYAAWMIRAYEELLDCRELELRVEACRAIIHAWDKTTICARYDRVLIPWRRRGSDHFAMCVSLRRGEPAAVPSDTDALTP